MDKETTLSNEEIVQTVMGLQERQEKLEEMLDNEMATEALTEAGYENPQEKINDWLDQTRSAKDKVSSMLNEEAQEVVEKF